ncbi:MAG TPA: hypothetical protein VGA96_14865 [Fibrella sp.]
MEKQPVDDLFARKLRDVEAAVGPDLFDQLQKRIATKPIPVRRTIVAWWHVASAACVLVALWFVYITATTEPPVSVPVAHKHLAKAKDHGLPAENAVATLPVHERQKHDVGSDAGKTEKHNSVARVTYPARTPVTPASQAMNKEPILNRSQQQSTERVAVVQSQEIQQVPVTPAVALNSTPVERIERVGSKQKQHADRTVVLTIEEPQEVNSLATVQNDSPAADPQLPQKGLSSLFGKIRQLKNGEVLAKVTPTTNQNSPKNRFGRIFTEMKESLKNETTLE